eukprot:3012659-Ditylum_brightwellii.AAC.1
MWQDVMAPEIKALQEMDCFDFQNDHTVNTYQKTIFHMMFNCKQDLRQKAQLVVGGTLSNFSNNKVYASNVKGINVNLLHMISQSAGLETLCGGICNAYVNAYMTEHVYAIAGPEFGSILEGKILCMLASIITFQTH